ncbi:mannose-6-phosphate isomerase, class I [Niallia sp. 01092]|uniref:mannose-6-phosphate isomerase, class I n=1 Tax=unclassified Niallia TaxID=2837522 RepID=UPI003FCFF9E7
MSQQPIFFDPIFQERIWGGTKLRSFGYTIPSDTTGECWAFAAHPNGQSVVKNGAFQGKTLGALWDNHRELFANVKGDRFPLLTKILDANQDLSVQVHPNDEYANKHENGELGKTECWYIVDCKDGAEIVFGHHAQSTEELKTMIAENRWNDLLCKVPVKKGDFFFVPSGTIHAIGEGIIILETQQNSDTTYRVYDYDRIDDAGNKRQLHINQSIAVTTVPHLVNQQAVEVEHLAGVTKTTFVKCDYFSVEKWELNGESSFTQSKPFLLCSVLEGQGKLNINADEYTFQKGDHFLLPSQVADFALSGNSELIVSYL